MPGGWWRPFLSTAAGVALAIVIDRLTDYFTGTHGAPVKEIRDSTRSGPATTILSGLGVGYESSVWSVVVIALTIGAAIVIYAGVPVQQFVATAVLIVLLLAGLWWASSRSKREADVLEAPVPAVTPLH